MERLEGDVAQARVYTEEGRLDAALALSKVLWFGSYVLFPLAVLRITASMFGFLWAAGVLVIFLVIRKIFGPLVLVALDELLTRIIPEFRSSVRMGTVPVRDFRVVRDDGRMTGCILRGDLAGGGIAAGDRVELEGYVRRGTFMVQGGRNLTTGAQLSRRGMPSGVFLVGSASLLILLLMLFAGVFDDGLWALAEYFFLEGEAQ